MAAAADPPEPAAVTAAPLVTLRPLEPTAHGGDRLDTAEPPSGPRRWGLGAWAAVALSALLAVLVPVLVLADAAVPGRALLCVAFVIAVPGVPVALALRLPDQPVTAALAVAISPAAAMLAATTGVLTDAWDPTGALLVLAGTGLVATAVAVTRELLHARPVLPSWRAAGGPEPAVRAAVLGLLVLALVLWWAATRVLDPRLTGPAGLVLALPWTYWAALVLVAAAAALALTRPRPDHVAIGAVVGTLVLVAYGVVNVADGAGSVGAGWVQVGFAEAIARTGDTVPGVDARFSWPGFLAGIAQLTTWAGLPGAGPLLVLAPVVFELLTVPALWVIGRAVTASPRLAWVGVVLYLLVNWYQQDYFSAQATASVLGTGVLAVLLWAATAAPPGPDDPRPWWRRALTAPLRLPARPAGVDGPTTVALDVLLLVVLTAVIVGHQLTPTVLLAALAWFVLAGATRHRTLVVAAFVLFVGWFSYGATDYWTGHLATVFGDVGQVGSVVSAGVGDRIAGDPVYQAMQLVRVGWTALLGLLAAVGWWLLRRERSAVLVLGLAAAPAALVLVQSYGGEVVIRCALYASPFLAPLAAVALARLVCPARGLRRGVPGLVPVLVAAGLVAGSVALTTTRGVNVSFEHVAAVEVDAARLVHASARPGQSVAGLGPVGPLPMAGVGVVRAEGLVDRAECSDRPYPACVAARLGPTGDGGPDWVYATAGMEAEGVLQGEQPPGWVPAGLAVLQQSGRYRTVVATDDVVVLEKVGRVEPSIGRNLR
ncbi:hypothetical protein [Actinomycetospora flava]|uniref:Serine/threonine protein kinase n=1 Tax=Actinomycetospora flava TaxID=3129232 RepID=A0ABU8MAC0_9PSEU